MQAELELQLAQMAEEEEEELEREEAEDQVGRKNFNKLFKVLNVKVILYAEKFHFILFQERLEEEMLDQMIAEDILCQEMLNAMLDTKPSELLTEPILPYTLSPTGITCKKIIALPDVK